MRIGIVCPYSFDEPGGVQAHIYDLATILITRGHTVRVLGPAAEETDVPDFVVKGGGSFPIRYNGSVARLSFGLHVRRTVKRFLREGQFDVLHIHEPNSPSYSMAVLRMAEGPIVATYHASAESSLLLNIFKPILRPVLDKVRAGIAVSEMARRWQVEQLGGDPVLIPNGVDTSVYAQHRVPLEEKTAPVEIVFLGRLDESRKGLDVLLEALHQLDRDVRVTIMGGGRKREVPGIDFVGRVSDAEKAAILGRADIYVAPNLGGESFGIVLVEAMAAGCAVVASDLEAFEVVCDAANESPAGVLFRTGDSADLMRVLRMLVDNFEHRRRLVEAGIKRAHNFDWESVATQVETVYETVVNGTKVRYGK
ncbi:glycosyltransferase family 4 protein [Corynebacterium pseudodiphtheriticum]|uniref:glycosyltransferase family 4 protein n=1 Tax=Corynebacterium pseudodiphtheriticum TaxID=37637 RepID=UPI0025439418|nr:glycosyltransferase family 4 protein [Corynebacterium pseudodiphtheriticum]MDK4249518.1 glycosyltransferase family 4 protein [Corynebacterium pseudodiphtheriticum]MDK4287869.1 glycosyltransferase family 4 protein [Corynebacterium pseudodiphtheriticum]